MTREQMRNRAWVFDGGGKTDAAQVWGQRLQRLQGKHQLIAAFAFCEGVDFVHDHPLQTGEHAGRVFVAGQQREAFRRGQQNMRRIGALARFWV